MVSECKRIYENIKKDLNNTSDKVWILYNKNLAEKENTPDPDIEMTWLLENGTINKVVPYFRSTLLQVDRNGFSIDPEIHFNIFLNEKRILLAYHFGKGFSRCIGYDLKCVNGEYSIENPQDIWVG